MYRNTRIKITRNRIISKMGIRYEADIEARDCVISFAVVEAFSSSESALSSTPPVGGRDWAPKTSPTAEKIKVPAGILSIV